MAQAVRFDEYGDVDVLQVVEVAEPEPGAGEVVVRVVAAGINPGRPRFGRGRCTIGGPRVSPPGRGVISLGE